MEFVGAGAVGLIFIGIVFLILVPVAAKYRTHGKSREQQRLEFYEDYDARMEQYKQDYCTHQGVKKKRAR
jgi:hypothetical protein